MNSSHRILLVLFIAAGFAAMGPNAAWAQNLCVTASRANLRAGPGKEHRITWEVNRNMPLIQVERQGEWIKVRDVDDEFHWISDQMVAT
ncbi:MAG: SH3 domain-containing protein, partial [Deltaproteobacteria bacterium]|nr:SH3 domain-containing protein [Deltaproteobacteria bacterium]